MIGASHSSDAVEKFLQERFEGQGCTGGDLRFAEFQEFDQVWWRLATGDVVHSRRIGVGGVNCQFCLGSVEVVPLSVKWWVWRSINVPWFDLMAVPSSRPGIAGPPRGGLVKDGGTRSVTATASAARSITDAERP
jgi:hypothetical protein